ncbi:MAG TPA: discoidin domain-containing protein [Planctomycetota bacterium]|nr:discoidin domain-containing protein [Planctomycetota bacterium]
MDRSWVLSVLASLLATASSAGEPVPGRAPLVLELPKPQFIGTPVNLKTPNLEKPRPGKRPDLLVPVGVANVALKKPVTASDTSPIMGELSQVTDGDRDGIEGSYVEIGPGKQYFQVDLKERYQIHAIVVWHYHAQARVYHDVVVQLSDDPAFSRNVRTVYNNDHDNSSRLGIGTDKEYIDSHEGLLIDATGAEARYVRLWGNGNTETDLNHCTEIEVYAKKAPAP